MGPTSRLAFLSRITIFQSLFKNVPNVHSGLIFTKRENERECNNRKQSNQKCTEKHELQSHLLQNVSKATLPPLEFPQKISNLSSNECQQRYHFTPKKSEASTGPHPPRPHGSPQSTTTTGGPTRPQNRSPIKNSHWAKKSTKGTH